MAYSNDQAPQDLTALTTLATDDTIIVGDTSDVSEVSKSITKANLITDLSSSFAAISTGTSAPSTTPANIGSLFIDTTNSKLYFAKGTTSSADWIITN